LKVQGFLFLAQLWGENHMFRKVVFVLALCCAVIGLSSIALAQDMQPVEPLQLSGEPVVLEFSTGAAGPPTIEPLTDGRMAFRIMGAGEISGAFEGSISVSVSEVTAMPSPPLHPTTVIFTIETEDGTLEGFYAGSLYLAEGSDQAVIRASGTILSVSGVYADLYLADVSVTSAVQFVDGRSVGESGTMTITVADTLTYTDPAGMFTLDYPVELAAVRPDLARTFGFPFPSVGLADTDATTDLSAVGQPVPAGGWGIGVMFIPEAFLVQMGMPADASLSDLAMVFTPQPGNAEGSEVVSVSEITLADGTAAIEFTTAGVTEDGVTLFYEVTDGVYVLAALLLSPGGRTDALVEALMQTVDSIEFTGTVEDIMAGMGGE
jgi:hypothetical protein